MCFCYGKFRILIIIHSKIITIIVLRECRNRCLFSRHALYGRKHYDPAVRRDTFLDQLLALILKHFKIVYVNYLF